MNADPAFMEIVQLHERTWGMEQYPGRPSLVELLNSPLIVMWAAETRTPAVPPSKRLTETQDMPSRFMFSIHKTVPELDAVLAALCISGRTHPLNNRRLFRIYLNQKPLKVKGVRLMVSEE